MGERLERLKQASFEDEVTRIYVEKFLEDLKDFDGDDERIENILENYKNSQDYPDVYDELVLTAKLIRNDAITRIASEQQVMIANTDVNGTARNIVDSVIQAIKGAP